MGKNYDNDEMEIDLLELFYVLKSKILAILGVGLLFGCIACSYAGFLVKPHRSDLLSGHLRQDQQVRLR